MSTVATLSCAGVLVNADAVGTKRKRRHEGKHEKSHTSGPALLDRAGGKVKGKDPNVKLCESVNAAYGARYIFLGMPVTPEHIVAIWKDLYNTENKLYAITGWKDMNVRSVV
jgi:hypothetical protein